MNTIFFDTRNFFIEKKRKSSRSSNQFRIYNDRKECIAYIVQKKTFFQKIIGLNIFSFEFEIRSANGVLKVSLSRKFPWIYAGIVIKDADGKKIGSIKQRFSLFKKNIKILNVSNEVIAAIYGNKRDLCFRINNATQNEIGEIKQRENNLRNTSYKSNCKYEVAVEEICNSSEDKIAILTSALAINVILQMIL